MNHQSHKLKTYFLNNTFIFYLSTNSLFVELDIYSKRERERERNFLFLHTS